MNGGLYSGSSGRGPFFSSGRGSIALGLSADFGLFRADFDVNLGVEAVEAAIISSNAIVALLPRLYLRILSSKVGLVSVE